MVRIVYPMSVLRSRRPNDSLWTPGEAVKPKMPKVVIKNGGGYQPGPGGARPAKKRATPKNARSVPKVGPKAPLVERVIIERRKRTPMPSSLLIDHYGGEPPPYANLILETTIPIPGWRIRWDEVSVSQNVLMRKYANHHAYGRLVKTWVGIFEMAMHQGRIPKATGRRRLTITRYVRDGKYLLDRANCSGGFKPYLDAAVRADLLRDDREGDLDDHYQQAIDPDERVEILVEDI